MLGAIVAERFSVERTPTERGDRFRGVCRDGWWGAWRVDRAAAEAALEAHKTLYHSDAGGEP